MGPTGSGLERRRRTGWAGAARWAERPRRAAVAPGRRGAGPAVAREMACGPKTRKGGGEEKNNSFPFSNDFPNFIFN